MFTLILNTCVLGITVFFVSGGSGHIEKYSLFGLCIGLGLMSFLLSLFIGLLSIVVVFGVTVVALKWMCDMTTKQSLIATAIFTGWQFAYAIAKELLFA